MGKKITAEPFLVLSTAVYVAHTLTMPQFVIDIVCQRQFNASVCENLEMPELAKEQDVVHQVTAFWMGALLMCSIGPSVITTFIWGPIGDIIGRTKVMVVPPIFMFLQSAVYLIISLRMADIPHPALLLIGSFLSSIYGETQGVVALANSYMADISVAEGRTFRIGILESCMFLAMSVSSILCGSILFKFGYAAIFVMTGILSVFNFIYVKRFLQPDQFVSGRIHRKRDYRVSNGPLTVGSFKVNSKIGGQIANQRLQSEFQKLKCSVCNMLREICSTTLNRRLCLLLVSFTFTVIPSLGEIMLGVLFVKHYPFNFKALDIGIFASVQSVLRSVALIVTYAIFIHWLKFSDYFIITVGLFFQVAYYILIGLSRSTGMLYCVQLLGMLTSLPYPAIRSSISKQVDEHRHGSVLAITESVDALSALITSLMANSVYAATVSIYSGFFSFLLALSSAISLIIVSVIYARDRRSISIKEIKIDEKTKLINETVQNGYVPNSTEATYV